MRVTIPVLAASLTFASRAAAQPAPAALSAASQLGADEARVQWVRGPVEVSSHDAPGAPHPAGAGETLRRGARVHVGDGGLVELAFANGTVLTLDDRAQLLLFASPLAPPPGQAPSTATTLLRGTARVRMAPVQTGEGAPLAPLSVGPATAFLGRVDGLVALDHVSRVVRLAANRGRLRVRMPDREYVLRAGNASVEEPGRPRQPYRQLPPQPVWVTAPPVRVLSSGEPVEVSATFGLRGSTVAAGWRVELARDEAFHDLVASERLAGEATSWRARDLAPGRYLMRVTALDNDRFEGLPSTVAPVLVAAPHVVPAVLAGGAQPPRVTLLEVPDGFFCGIDGARPVATNTPIPLSPGRRHAVRCASTPDGGDAREITLTAQQSGPLVHEVRMRNISLDQGVLAVRLFDAEGRAVPYAEVAVTNDRGVVVDVLREAAERGVYNAPARWPRGVRRARFRFTVNGAETFEEVLSQGE